MWCLRFLAGLMCAAAATQWSGCIVAAVGAAGAAGAGTVAYVRGELAVTLEKNYEAVVAASNHALGDLRLAKISERTDALSSVIIARTARDKKVTLALAKTSDRLVQVKIRVGWFGDEPMALAILDKIKANL